MFKRVLQALFSPFVDSKNKPSAEPVQQEQQQTVATDSVPSSIFVPPSSAQPSSLIVDKTLSLHDGEFLDYLFGESRLRTESDPFSDFVACQIERLIRSPKALLNELPVMPASVTTLMAELQSDEFDIDALLRVIEREPSMAADVIKLANSAFYKRGEKQVTDLKTAFLNMGSQGLVEGVVNSYMKNFTPGNNIYWRHFGEKIWYHSVQTASFSKELMKDSSSQEDQAAAYFVGLIRNLGKMIIFQMMVEAFKHVDPSVPPNSLALKRLMNSYSIRLTYTIAKFWELPESVLTAIGYQESSRYECTPLGQAVFEANYLSELKYLLEEQAIEAEQFKTRCKETLLSPAAFKVANRIYKESELSLVS
ncbi:MULTISPECIES: HDOD domain-containing protein [Vibrio]|uniref:HDOD domain-containing protein n=1 Tax=Vibrio TaxID=662 RepID=UPI000C828085|nr:MULTISPECIES: HDOD domain-containing protein [unclassified Vibrio]PMI22434.1 HDOD domain-containing protein [Vibrio sp. 10N.286.46.E10]PMI88065.1 HDOD domain-containing protein [Vibrio sp. 10N.286.45.E10]PTP10034.1 HDOD domain-containing protein [Vibrio sp. 10N.286.45.A3]PTQ25313.1 HDOD domain-containing protein [Vibrio sp. 10N.286.46.E10]TKE75385.1 HDOD domain-containing protein [Vibrio sp. F12]